MAQIYEGAPAHGAPTGDQNGVHNALPNGKGNENIKVSELGAYTPPVPWGIDVALRGGRNARYVNDPRPGENSGIWRTGRSGDREPVTPFAIVQIEVGRHESEITVVLPQTGDRRILTGDPDRLADGLVQAGARRGFRGDRRHVFWAVSEFIQAVRRQAAARGAC